MLTYNMRVSFAETDAGGIVYHARYFEMAEQSRNRVLAEVGISVADWFYNKNIGLVLRRAQLEFLSPAILDDDLTVKSGILTLSATRSWWRTIVQRRATMICLVDAELVCMNREKRAVQLYPENLMSKLSAIPEMSGKPPGRRNRR